MGQGDLSEWPSWRPISEAPDDRWVLCAWGSADTDDPVDDCMSVLILDDGIWMDQDENHYCPTHFVELPAHPLRRKP